MVQFDLRALELLRAGCPMLGASDTPRFNATEPRRLDAFMSWEIFNRSLYVVYNKPLCICKRNRHSREEMFRI
jgi:hypothetical protein